MESVNKGADESDDEEDGLDPSHTDTDRTCISSAIAQKLRQWTDGKPKCFIPCRIRFTLLAQQTSSFVAKKWDFPRDKSQKGKVRATIDPSVSCLTVGSDDSVARLTCGTLWFSNDAAVILRDLLNQSLLTLNRRGNHEKFGAEAFFILLEARNVKRL